MTNRFKITSLLLSILMLVLIPVSVHASDSSDYERYEAAVSRSDGKGINRISTIYATSNIDMSKAIDYYKTMMLWNDDVPYQDDELSDDVYFNVSLKEQGDNTYVFMSLKTSLSSSAFSYMARVQEISSYDGAEFIIGETPYDCYSVLVDGNTYQKELGSLINSAVKEIHKNYQKYPEFVYTYEDAAKLSSTSYEGSYYTSADGTDYKTSVFAKVGFNYTVDGYAPSSDTNVEDNVTDDSAYGGSEDNKIGTYETTDSDSNYSNIGRIIGISISSVLGVVMIYLIYVVIRKFLVN